MRRLFTLLAAAFAVVLLAASPAAANPKPTVSKDTDCAPGGWVAILTLTNNTSTTLQVNTISPAFAGITAGTVIPVSQSVTGTRQLPSSTTTQTVAVTGGPLLPWIVTASFTKPDCYHPVGLR